MKKLLCILLAAAMLLLFASCESEKTESVESEVTSEPVAEFISTGNLTVSDISQKLNELGTVNGFGFTVKQDKTDSSSPYIIFAVNDASGEEAAEIDARSDLEKKAASFTIKWNYAESDAINAELLAVSRALLIEMWPEYDDSQMRLVEKTFSFSKDDVDKLVETNVMKATPGSNGYVYLNMSLGKISIGIKYSNTEEFV